MDRKNFFRVLGLGGLVVVTPKLLAFSEEKKIETPAEIPAQNPLETIFLSKSEVKVALFTSGGGDTRYPREANYEGYRRTPLGKVKCIAGSEYGKGLVENAEDVVFPICTGGRATITDFGIVTDEGVVWQYPLASTFYISAGMTPMFAKGDITIMEE